jgi:peptidoglycan/xylan/chitin deacetylase (PgdA/CDA1 family)
VWRLSAERARRRRSVILCYHGVARVANRAADPEFYCVAPHAFERQVELLEAAGFEFVTVAELAERSGDGPPSPGMAALTFDDGSKDIHANVRPLLLRRGIRATAYITTGMIDQPNPFLPPAANANMMNVDELRELLEAGFELGAHTVTHPDLAQLDEEACLQEMVESRETLQRLTGARVTTFAYPFCTYGPAAVSAARRAGFEAAVTCHGRGGGHRHELARSIVTGKDGLPSFVLKLHGAYEPMYYSPPGRLLRAATAGLRRRVRVAVESRG